MKSAIRFLAAVLAAVPFAALAQDFPMAGVSLGKVTTGTDYLAVTPIQDEAGDTTGVEILFMNDAEIDPAMQAYSDSLSADEATQKAAAEAVEKANLENSAPLGRVIGLRTEKLEELKEKYGIDNSYTELGENGGYTYFSAKAAPGAADSLSAESRALYEQKIPAAEEMLSGAALIPIVKTEISPNELAFADLGEFTTTDMDGNTVTRDIFGRAELTVLNVWATNCGPCVKELPSLAAWAKELPENVQIIGIVYDVESADDANFETARQILADSGVTYTNLLMCDDMEAFADGLTGTPVTYFVDSDGDSVAPPVSASAVYLCRETVSTLLGN